MSMRLSTNQIYAMGSRGVLRQQSEVARIGEQLSSNRRVVTPADDPRAAAQSVILSQASQANDQYAATRDTARSALSLQETELTRVTDALPSVKALLVRAGNQTLSDADRASIASDLDGLYQQILGSANAQDGNGNHLFSGFDSKSPAFQGSRGALTYAGDDGQRELRVDGNRRMAVNDSGASIFASTTANSKYVARADADNAGSATFDAITVRDSSAGDFGHAFELSFGENTAGERTYSVRDRSAGTTLVTDALYDPAKPIDIGDSMRLDFSGSPAAGDRFTLGQGQPEDSNILNALAEVADRLRQPTADAAATAAVTNAVNTAQRQTDNALDNVSQARASIGTRLAELDTLDTIGSSRDVNYESRLSELRDLDPVKAISDYSLASVALQFAQKTFLDIQQLSLFSLR